MSNPEKWEIEFDLTKLTDPYPVWTRVLALGTFSSENDAKAAAHARARVAGVPLEKYRVKRAGSFIVVSRDLAGEFNLQCDEEFFSQEEAREFIKTRAKTLGVSENLYNIQPRF